MPPVVWITIAFALGIGLASAGDLVEPPAALAAALLVLLGTTLSFWRGRRETPLFLLLCFSILGYAWGEFGEKPFPSSLRPFLGHYVELEGTLEAPPVKYPNRVLYTLTDTAVTLGGDSWRGPGRIQVAVYTGVESEGMPEKTGEDAPAARVDPGRRLLVKGRLDLAPLPANPGDFNYRAYLERKGIIAVLTADDAPDILEQKQDARYLLPRLLASARWRIEDGIARAVPSEQAALLRGFLLGSTEGITPEDREIYRRTGVLHLFAVSGLNIGFVLLLFLGAARCLRLGRGPAFLLVAGGIWSYAALIGFPASVTRAAVMGTVGLGGFLWQQRQNPYNSLALAALVILLLDPAALLDPGFQLSFAATWGILSLAGPLGSLLSFKEGNPLLEGCREVIAVSLAAQLAVLPLCALYFGQIPILALPANVLVVPPAGAVVSLVLAGMLLSLPHPSLGGPFYIAAGALTVPIQGVLRILAGIPGAAPPVPPPSWVTVAAWFPLLALLGRSLRRGTAFPHFRFTPFARRLLLPSLLGLFSLLAVIYAGGRVWPLAGDRPLRVTFLNVGQGDSVLVEVPNGRSMLVDAGGRAEFERSSFDPGQRIVVPYLIRSGIRRLDLVVNTHPHEDHLGGVPAVLEALPVDNLVFSPVWSSTPLELQVEKIAREKGIAVHTVDAGDSLHLDPRVKIEVLNPHAHPFSGTESDANNNSLVLLLRYKEISFLLTGDAEKDALESLAAGLTPGAKINVLKAPHHGSRTGICPTLAGRLRPQFVVISVGRNSFGHPDPETVNFWRENGARVLRTDEAGAVIFETDGVRLRLKTTRQSPKQIPMARAA